MTRVVQVIAHARRAGVDEYLETSLVAFSVFLRLVNDGYLLTALHLKLWGSLCVFRNR